MVNVGRLEALVKNGHGADTRWLIISSIVRDAGNGIQADGAGLGALSLASRSLREKLEDLSGGFYILFVWIYGSTTCVV